MTEEASSGSSLGVAACSLPALHHVGMVVADMDATAADFGRRWGVGLSRVFDGRFTGALFRGERVEFEARYGFISTGASQIELIQPVSGPSPYTEYLRDKGCDGVHHLAYFVEAIDDFLEQLVNAGVNATPVLDAQLTSGGRFVYLEGTAHGPLIELIEMSRPTSDG
jgi:methylmalonyl-CoA/ethylmalonyl-CoA epimerase